MSYDINNKIIANLKGLEVYLIDTSAFCRFEELEKLCGINILNVIKGSAHSTFLIPNSVILELANGPRTLDYKFLTSHIINSEYSGDPNWKENRLIVQENDKLAYIVGNKVSATDYALISLCQNHPELFLVSNDKKMLKNALIVLEKEHVLGAPMLIDRLISKGYTKDLQKLKEVMGKVFEMKKL